MKIRYKPKTQAEVLDLFRQRKISTQRAADLLGLSYGEFTCLASQHGIPTSTGGINPELVDIVFGQKTS